ncbi:MAG TPA: type II CAAX endopeptidase family protein [Candidatus Saccharimonadales bacterium]|nr:type II CAAX endopeptidase family protein [Candidatus Saccharimonadales bacterium]
MSKDSSRLVEKDWNTLAGVGVGLVALFGSQIVVGIILSIYPAIEHWNGQKANDWLNNSIAAQFIFVLLAELLAVYIIYLFIRRYTDGFKRIGLRKPRLPDPLYGLLGLPPYFVLYFLLLNISIFFFPSLNTNEKQQVGFTNPHGLSNLILTFISLVVLPPIAEELIFRGVIYSSLKKSLPLWAAVLLTSLLFAAGHLPEGGSAGLLYVGAIDTFSLSLVLIYLREKTGGLWASMTLHALKNCIAFVALFALHLG